MTKDLFSIRDAVRLIPTSNPDVKLCNSFPMIVPHVIELDGDEVFVKLIGATTSEGPIMLSVVRVETEEDSDEPTLIQCDDEMFEELSVVFADYYKTYLAKVH